MGRARRKGTGRQRKPRDARRTAHTRVKRAGRPRTRGLKHPRSALVRVHPRRVVVVNVREQGDRRTEHEEAVKMVNFSRTKKPAKCDLNKQTRESLLEGARPRE